MSTLRVLLAIRDPTLSARLRGLVTGAGATLLGSIDPADPADFHESPDLVLMKAEEVAALKDRRRSILNRLHRDVPLLVVITGGDLSTIADLPQRVNGLIFDGREERLTLAQIELALAGYCLLPRDLRHFDTDWRRIIRERLDPQERRVLKALGLGRTNREIGAELGCSESRAKTLVRAVLTKLQTENRTMAGVIAAYIMRMRDPGAFDEDERSDGDDDANGNR